MYSGGVCPATPSWIQTPLDAYLSDADPLHGHVTCDACWEPEPPVNRQTSVKTVPFRNLASEW